MPAQSQNAANLDAGLMRFEPLSLGDSQVQPEFPYRQPEFLTPIEDSHFEPAVTVLSMSLHWERLLAHEKRRNRQLMFCLSSLQDQLQQADVNYKALRQQYERLCNGTDGNSQPGWGLQDVSALCGFQILLLSRNRPREPRQFRRDLRFRMGRRTYQGQTNCSARCRLLRPRTIYLKEPSARAKSMVEMPSALQHVILC